MDDSKLPLFKRTLVAVIALGLSISASTAKSFMGTRNLNLEATAGCMTEACLFGNRDSALIKVLNTAAQVEDATSVVLANPNTESDVEASLTANLKSAFESQSLQSKEMGENILKARFPELPLQKAKWTVDAEVVSIDPAEFVLAANIADGTSLEPVNKGQTAKQYHAMIQVRFNNNDVPADSPVCQIQSRGARRVCLHASKIMIYLVSDLYRDNNGNTYRGFDLRAFPAHQENLDTLVSPGHTLEPQGRYPHTYRESSHPVSASEFRFLAKTP